MVSLPYYANTIMTYAMAGVYDYTSKLFSHVSEQMELL